MTHTHIVIGGGVAGLIAATSLAKAGHPVVLVEKGSTLGGRAATRQKHGFSFNLGPHALYREGQMRRTLQSFGIDPAGAIPGGNGGYAIYQERLHTLPTGFLSLVTTDLLPLSAKFEFAGLLSRIGSIDTSRIQHETLTSWLSAHVRHQLVRDVLKMLVRVTSFINAPDQQSAGAAIEQLQLGARGNVLYLDGGWQTFVDGLRRAATAAGAKIISGAPAVALERGGRTVTGVRLSDGTLLPSLAVIVTGSPADVDALAGTSFLRTLPPPVRHATLDIGLRSLPNPKRLVAFGVDRPLYFSVHSAVANLAPSGAAVLHVSKYLEVDETADRETEKQLERLADEVQPGWRSVVYSQQFLQNLTVTHTMPTAATGGAAGRPSVRLASADNVFIAGDWVGARGQLSDAAAASALDAAAAVAQMSPAHERREPALAS